MAKESIPSEVQEKAQKWLNGQYDNETKTRVKAMLENEDASELIDSFYRDLAFGTGGLRGIMGIGSNRMNRYTVGGGYSGPGQLPKKRVLCA